MDGNQHLPFERNRYYVGKLLTSADFSAEQIYGNHKRCFMNEMMFGSGVVCGLGVYSLDDLSIMVDSGVAIDGCGREVVLENSLVKRLSTVDGFEELESDQAVLCLAYQEEEVQPVYAIRSQESGEGYEHNRIREGCKLVLRDSNAMTGGMEPDSEFLSSASLYSDDDYAVTCSMPAQSACGRMARFDVRVERLNPEAGPLTLNAAIQAPAFVGEDGSHELVVDLDEFTPEEPVTLHYWLHAQERPAPDCVLLAGAKTITARVGDQQRFSEENFSLRAAVVDLTPEQIVDQASSAASLEMRMMLGGQELVPLAEITMQRTRNAYIIEKVDGTKVRRYVRTVAEDENRRALSGWFRDHQAAAGQSAPVAVSAAPAEKYAEPIYATGICEIPLDPNARRGQVAFSDEIVHGLGTGTVFVSVAPEYLADDPRIGSPARNTVYGTCSIFANQENQMVNMETAVKVMDDRGSFMVGVRLLEDTAQAVLQLRWVAVAMPNGGEENKIQKMAGKSIAAVQPTVVMATRENHYFNVRFKNMEPCTLTYELTEKDSGSITSDGIYTAPGREGVFEIRISCADMPLISTYAYAVVKKREAAEDQEK